MLDAFIIDKIRRERESRESVRQPLRIEVPRPLPSQEPPEPGRDDRDPPERGVVIIDFTI